MAFEKALLKNTKAEWEAMNRAGRSLAKAVLRDFCELGDFPDTANILILAGKGHNAGDAFIAAHNIRKQFPNVKIYYAAPCHISAFKPLTLKAFERLDCERIRLEQIAAMAFDLCLDGLLGMQFKAPLRDRFRRLITAVNEHPAIRLRAAVDLPSGVGDYSFRADFTYATGIAKAPLFETQNKPDVGRVRYLDIGFFERPYSGKRSVSSDIVTPNILAPLAQLRDPFSDKRSYGHLLIISGSRRMPGALMMAVQAALRSGVGLVTVCAPESIVATCAASMPEAMWIPWPETPDGFLALEGRYLLKDILPRCSAVLSGPGIGKEAETFQLIKDLLKEVALPFVLDADVLNPETLDVVAMRSAQMGPVVVTPHWGEYERMSGTQLEQFDVEQFKWFSHKNNLITLLKGQMPCVTDGEYVACSPFGGPVLARGGSGDILSGLVAGLLAQKQTDAFTLTCQAAVWHGLSADFLAQEKGQVAVRTTQLLDYLPIALRQLDTLTSI